MAKRKNEIPPRIFAAAVIKGGTGKTTTCAALAQAAAADNKKVLAVDLDPQASFTTAINGDPNRAGSYALLTGADAGESLQKTAQGIYCIAGGSDLAAIHTKPGSGKRLREALEPIKDSFDFVFIDTPPTMGELQNNALQAATDLIIPLEADPDSLQGLYQIADIARHIQRSNAALNITGIVLTRYDNRPKLNRYYKDVITQKAQEVNISFLAAIRQGIAIKEARATRQSLFEYAPDSNPARDYMKLYEKLTRRANK